MSWQACHWAKSMRTGTPAKKAVIMVLAEGTDRWGYMFDSEKAIAWDAELSVRQARRLLRDLADANVIAILQMRGAKGQLVNLYRMGFRVDPKDEKPEGHPALNDKFKRWRGPETLRVWGDDIDSSPAVKPEDKLSHGPEDKLSSGQRTNDALPEDKSRVSSGQVMSSSSKETMINPESRARDPDDPKGSGSSAAPEAEENKTPANAYWRSKQEELKAALHHPADYGVWFIDLVPESDDGETLVLATPHPMNGRMVIDRYGPVLREVFPERKITFEYRDWAASKRAKRRAKAGQK